MMRSIALISLLGLAVTTADARGRKDRKDPPTDAEAPAIAAPAALPAGPPLFPDGLVPTPHGGTPDGLANASAQGCRACHADAEREWRASDHATPPSPALLAAASAAAGTACLVCHLPLVAQHPEVIALDEGQVARVAAAPNTAYDATLRTEGVTCAACHVRDGQVLTGGGRGADAPHTTAGSEELANGAVCATCHQLSWPGADTPLYDTWGEWERSGWAGAGIGCVDCHMGPSAGRTSGGRDHRLQIEPGSGMSLLVSVPPGRIARGGAPVEVSLRLQNTGAGHAIPTGSPHRGLRVEASVISEAGGEAVAYRSWNTDLLRRLEPAPPWRSLADTRLAAGGARSETWSFELDLAAPPGPWWLEVRVVPLAVPLEGPPTEVGPPYQVQRVALNVD
jgi:hypothetical protein